MAKTVKKGVATRKRRERKNIEKVPENKQDLSFLRF